MLSTNRLYPFHHSIGYGSPVCCVFEHILTKLITPHEFYYEVQIDNCSVRATFVHCFMICGNIRDWVNEMQHHVLLCFWQNYMYIFGCNRIEKGFFCDDSMDTQDSLLIANSIDIAFSTTKNDSSISMCHSSPINAGCFEKYSANMPPIIITSITTNVLGEYSLMLNVPQGGCFQRGHILHV